MKNEKMSDVDLETQFELDSTYIEGNYKVILDLSNPRRYTYELIAL